MDYGYRSQRVSFLIIVFLSLIVFSHKGFAVSSVSQEERLERLEKSFEELTDSLKELKKAPVSVKDEKSPQENPGKEPSSPQPKVSGRVTEFFLNKVGGKDNFTSQFPFLSKSEPFGGKIRQFFEVLSKPEAYNFIIPQILLYSVLIGQLAIFLLRQREQDKLTFSTVKKSIAKVFVPYGIRLLPAIVFICFYNYFLLDYFMIVIASNFHLQNYLIASSLFLLSIELGFISYLIYINYYYLFFPILKKTKAIPLNKSAYALGYDNPSYVIVNVTFIFALCFYAATRGESVLYALDCEKAYLWRLCIMIPLIFFLSYHVFKTAQRLRLLNRSTSQHFSTFSIIWSSLVYHFYIITPIIGMLIYIVSPEEKFTVNLAKSFASFAFLLWSVRVFKFLPASFAEHLPKIIVRYPSLNPIFLKIQETTSWARAIIALFLGLSSFTVLLGMWHPEGVSGFLSSKVIFIVVVKALSLSLIILGAFLVIKLGRAGLEKIVKQDDYKDNIRLNSLILLFKNIWIILITIVALLLILSELGVNTAPIIATLGIGSLGLGIGLQPILKDVFSGFSIILSDAMGLGDSVTLGDKSGVVESINFRYVKLRSDDGTLNTIPLGSIASIANNSRGHGWASITLQEKPGIDINKVFEVCLSIVEEMKSDTALKGLILSSADINGVNSITVEAIEVQLRIKTKAGSQGKVKRAFLARYAEKSKKLLEE